MSTLFSRKRSALFATALSVALAGCAGPQAAEAPAGGAAAYMRAATDGEFDVLSADLPFVVPRLGSASFQVPPPYSYAVRGETSGVTEDLYAVAIEQGRAYAVGIGGVVVRRTQHQSWQRENAGTDRTLRSVAVARFEAENSSNTARDPDTLPVYAVGDGGTIVRRGTHGTWRPEASGTTRDLYAVFAADDRVLAAGDGGTLLERRAETWRVVRTHTTADLRAISGSVVVGRGGSIVECTKWPRTADVTALALLACVPRPSPVTNDLFALCKSGRTSRLVATGAEGIRVRDLGHDRGRLTFELWPTGIANALRGVADNRWGWKIDVPAKTIAVGERGALFFIGDEGGDQHVIVPGAPDLFGVAFERLDAFMVGARGTILHARVEGTELMTVIAL